MNSRLVTGTLRDPLVSDDVPYAVLTPAGWTVEESLPLVVLLHGAQSSSAALGMLRPVVDSSWADDSLPRCVLACASTPTVGGFYIDRPGGDAWESLVATALPRLVQRTFGTDPHRVSLLGSSMGGYGALKIAFAEPGRWQAVAAIAPALLPATTPERLRPRNTVGVLADLGREMAGHDGRRFADNSVLHRLRANADAIRTSGLPIFLRCGDRDVFAMHDGTEQLHRALWDLDVGHEYHLVFGADHLGPEATAAARAALRFLGDTQRTRAGTDRTTADRDLEAAWRGWADGDRRGTPPPFDAASAVAPVALRLMLEPELAETLRRDPTTARRFGVLDPD